MAQLAVPNVEPLWIPINEPVYDPVLYWFELEIVPTGTGAYDAEMALLAQLLVPINLPVNDPVNDPVLIWSELLIVPAGIGT